jgi:NTP pyrophosphatase (non-canonical NTP hydrolase)
MNLQQYQNDASRTCPSLGTEVLGGRELKTTDNIHMVLGMQTETAELSDVFKKHLAYNKPIDWVNAKEEIGDLMWYISNFCRINNINLEEIMQTNIEKLKIRFPDKFSQENAINRNLEKERVELEKNI